jgi:hypothetical protein
MRFAGPILAAAALLAAPSAARGAFTGAFDGLRAELEIREAGLQGNQDPQSLLQLRAIGRSYDAMDGSGTLAGDCSAAGRVAVLLVRAFPDDFAAGQGFAADLSDHLADAYQRLVDEVYRERADVLDRSRGLRPGTAFRVRRAVDACDRDLERALRAPRWRALARRLAAAVRDLDRATRIADADTVK